MPHRLRNRRRGRRRLRGPTSRRQAPRDRPWTPHARGPRVRVCPKPHLRVHFAPASALESPPPRRARDGEHRHRGEPVDIAVEGSGIARKIGSQFLCRSSRTVAHAPRDPAQGALAPIDMRVLRTARSARGLIHPPAVHLRNRLGLVSRPVCGEASGTLARRAGARGKTSRIEQQVYSRPIVVAPMQVDQ